MADIEDICVKTLFSCHQTLSFSYKTALSSDLENSSCFQILGMDVMIDSKLKPWLIEVNSLPSFMCDSPLDEKVKSSLIKDTIHLLNLTPERRKRLLNEKMTPINKQKKLKLRSLNMAQRDIWDRENLGNFR